MKSLNREATIANLASRTIKSPSVVFIFSICGRYDRASAFDVLGNLQVESGNRVHMFRCRSYTYFGKPEVAQDLCADTVGPQHGFTRATLVEIVCSSPQGVHSVDEIAR